MNKNIVSLHNVPVGMSGKVRSIQAIGTIRRRLQDLGVIEDTNIECLQKSPSGDPIAYLIRGAVVAIRSEDSSKILVEVT